MPIESYTNFLKSPDQDARRAELLAFFGPNPDKFLKNYEQQVASANRVPGTSQVSGVLTYRTSFAGGSVAAPEKYLKAHL